VFINVQIHTFLKVVTHVSTALDLPEFADFR